MEILKSIITEMKNSLADLMWRICNLEDESVKRLFCLQSREKKKKRMRGKKQNLWEMWHTFKYTDICIMEPVKEGMEKQLFQEIIVENFPNLMQKY